MSSANPVDETVGRILAFAAEQDLDAERGTRAGEVVLVLPGEKKLRTVCSLLVGERDVSVSAFVVRNPDENHEGVYRFLLRRNLRSPGIAYAIDAAGDVFAVGRVPREALDAARLDSMLGAVLDAADSTFNDLLALGFLGSMKREWAWRVSRGESLRNLQAFAHLLDPARTGEHGGDEAPPEADEGDGRPEALGRDTF